nr:hypothetical protein [uncultured Desulfobacter sp.]
MMGTVKRCGWLTGLILCSFLIITASSHAAAVITGTLDLNTLEATLYTMPFDGSTGLTTISPAYLEVIAQKDEVSSYNETFNGTAISAEVDGAKATFDTSLLSVEIAPGDGRYYSASGWGYTNLTPATAGLLAISIDYTWEIDTSSFSEADWYSIDFYLAASTWDDDGTNKSVYSDVWIDDEYTSGTSGSGTLDLYVQVDGEFDVWVDGGIDASAYIAQTPVPLPSSFALFFTGIAGLAVFNRRNFM